MSFKYWQPLNKGDIIDIIAPSSAIPGNWAEELTEIKEFILELGFVARIPDDLIVSGEELIKEGHDPFCANTDNYRLDHLANALLANDSKAIWALRGGYGSARIIKGLEKLPQPATPKLFIGFSDITVLHLFFQQKWGWPTIHGKVLSQFCKSKQDKKSIDEIKQILFGKKEIEYRDLKRLNEPAQHTKTIEASIIGGNLSLVATSIGTSWQINGKDKIVFLEDVAERGYKIDRYLEQLNQSGIFKQSKAVIFGDFVDGQEKNGIDYTHFALQRFANEIDIPVLRCKGIGHGQVNHPLPLGTNCKLYLGTKLILVCQTGANIELLELDKNINYVTEFPI